MRRFLAGYFAFTLPLAALASSVGCGEGHSGSADRTLTSTITAGGARLLTVQAPVALEVTGHPSRTTILAALDVTITASTATRARTVAEGLVIDAVAKDEQLELRVAIPSDAGISGTLKLTVPAYLDLGLRVAGTVMVGRVDGEIGVEAQSSVKITGAKRSVAVAATAGNVLIDSDTPQSTVLDARTGSGDMELTLFERPSLDLEASVTGQGQVVIAHPAFPQAINSSSYRAAVNGGLAVARLLTGTGRIVIRSR